MKYFYIFTAIFITVSFFPLFAAEADIEFNIRLSDRRIYYTNSGPINIQITITNNSPDTYRFKLADERIFSVDFDIRTMTNRQLSEADNLIRKRTRLQQIYFREISMENGESFSFIEDLRDYVEFKQSGSYRVIAKIYPELNKSSNSPSIASNNLTLTISPPLTPGKDGIPLEMDIATGAALVPVKRSPDEVVEYMLKARMESQWERFFLYLDLEAMMTRNSVRKRQWLAENEEGRRKMIAAYRQELQNFVVDGDIIVIPFEYQIEETKYQNNQGTVTVLQKFRGLNFSDNFVTVRRYIYELERKDNIWMITNYRVFNLPSEAIP
ncbi:MAG: hypothetical protein LBB81_09785 [Treponema sp.]|jgi:hypothetical protein|nr:hypothetical protein [Treponema sp.]